MIGIYQEYGSLSRWEELIGSSKIRLPQFSEETTVSSSMMATVVRGVEEEGGEVQAREAPKVTRYEEAKVVMRSNEVVASGNAKRPRQEPA